MDEIDLLVLLPLILLAVVIVVELLGVAFYRRIAWVAGLALFGLAASFASLFFTSGYYPHEVTTLLVFDSTAGFYIELILAASFVVGALSYQYLKGLEGQNEEYYLLLLLATLGSIVLVTSNHFASFFLGLEILSVSLYSLISYPRAQKHRIEAGIKYLILAGATVAFLLFGMALIYAELGSMDFSKLAAALSTHNYSSPVPLVGLALLIVGIGFKLAWVPFQLWTPDVYQGAPAPVTGFVATVSKGAVFALLLRYFSMAPLAQGSPLWDVFAAIAILSMLSGNILALFQKNVKRVLAYSSIAHLGYLLVPFLAGGSLAQPSVAFYLAAYFATTLSAFGVITVLSTAENEAEEMEAYRGLFWRRPWLAGLFTLALVSLAGLPPSAGLFGKIYISAAGVQSSLWALVLVLVIASVIGVFYYMGIALSLYRKPVEGEAEKPAAPRLTSLRNVVLTVLGILVLGIGLYPTPLMAIVQSTIAGLK